MKETNSTEQLFDGVFRDTLGNAPSAVPPGAWEGISASLGHAATGTAVAGAAVKSALWVKGLLAACVLGATAATWWFVAQQQEKTNQIQVTHQVPETTSGADKTNVRPMPELQVQETEPAAEPAATSGSTKKSAAKSAEPQETYNNNPFSSYNNPDLTYGKTGTFSFHMPEQRGTETREHKADPLKSDNTGVPEKAEGYEGEAETEHEAETPPAPAAHVDSSYILVPDVFTADGDGINDTYQIVLIGEERYEMIIYSLKDNKILFRSKNKYQAWSGKMPDGEDAPSGTYMVKLVYKFKNKKEETKWVKLTLIR